MFSICRSSSRELKLAASEISLAACESSLDCFLTNLARQTDLQIVPKTSNQKLGLWSHDYTCDNFCFLTQERGNFQKNLWFERLNMGTKNKKTWL